MIENVQKLLEAGGSLMYVLTAIGLFIFYIGIYQLSWLLGFKNNPETFTSKKGVHVWANKALEMAKTGTGLQGLSLMDSLEVCFARMEESLSWRTVELRFCAQVSTLIGFLGTVTGMVKVFDTVARLGKATPADLAGGIHEALFTTVYGLIIALISWFFVHTIEMLVRKHMRSLEVLIFSELDNIEKSSESKEK